MEWELDFHRKEVQKIERQLEQLHLKRRDWWQGDMISNLISLSWGSCTRREESWWQGDMIFNLTSQFNGDRVWLYKSNMHLQETPAYDIYFRFEYETLLLQMRNDKTISIGLVRSKKCGRETEIANC